MLFTQAWFFSSFVLDMKEMAYAAHVVLVACRWSDMSYNRETSWSSAGPDGTGGYCAKLQGFGALAFEGNEGKLDGKKMISFAVQKDNSGNVPDTTVQLSSKKVRCAEWGSHLQLA
jgi:hypothetical protein